MYLCTPTTSNQYLPAGNRLPSLRHIDNTGSSQIFDKLKNEAVAALSSYQVKCQRYLDIEVMVLQ